MFPFPLPSQSNALASIKSLIGSDELSESAAVALGGDDSNIGLSSTAPTLGVKGSVAVLTVLANLDRLSATESVQVEFSISDFT